MKGDARAARVLVAVMLVGTALMAAPAIGAQPAWATTSKNLIKNGNADKGIGGSGGPILVPNWKATEGTSFTAVAYGSPGGFPDATSPGPKQRGPNFFAGGDGSPTDTVIVAQTDSLKTYAAAIARGGVGFTLQGYFGGYSTQNDQAQAKITFDDKNGNDIGAALTAPVTEVDRGGVTGLLKRRETGMVPAGAKTVFVQLAFLRTAGSYNDAYADSISLTLSGV